MCSLTALKANSASYVKNLLGVNHNRSISTNLDRRWPLCTFKEIVFQYLHLFYIAAKRKPYDYGRVANGPHCEARTRPEPEIYF